jgi:hypothetical protein
MVQICNLPSADLSITHNGQPGSTMNQLSSYLWHLLPLLTLATLRIISNLMCTVCSLLYAHTQHSRPEYPFQRPQYRSKYSNAIFFLHLPLFEGDFFLSLSYNFRFCYSFSPFSAPHCLPSLFLFCYLLSAHKSQL